MSTASSSSSFLCSSGARLFDFPHELPGEIGNRREIAGLGSRRETASHANRNCAGLNPLTNTFDPDAAGGHELRLGKRASHRLHKCGPQNFSGKYLHDRSEEHTSELQSPCNLVC